MAVVDVLPFPEGEPIGTLAAPGPYRAWQVNARRSLWAICGAAGWNCWGREGAVLLNSHERAEAVIRSHGHEPGPRRLDGEP